MGLLYSEDIKCIALDIDRTLLKTDGTIADETKAALKAANDAGVEIVLVTGRPYSALPECIKEIKGLRFVVTSNGAGVYNMVTGERLYAKCLKKRDVTFMLSDLGRYFNQGTVTYEAFVDGVGYAAEDYVRNPVRFGVPRSAAEYVMTTRKPVKYIIDFLYDHNTDMDSLDIIMKESSFFTLLENAVNKRTDEVYITSSVPYRMEISHKDTGKASGLQHALELLKIDMKNTAAFGDADNDADMLKAAGFGVAMANGSDSCKAAADYITQSNDENGIATALEYLV